jgi:hypothetical protein
MTNCNEKTMATSQEECQSEPKLTRYHIRYAHHDTTPNEWGDCFVGKLYFVRHYRECVADEYPHQTDVSDYSNRDDFLEALEKELPKGSIIEPVWMYSHGGETISRSPFSCRWDSGWVGVFVVTPQEAKRVHGWKKMSSKRWEIARKDSDTTFDMWKACVEGQVYEVSRVYTHDDEEEWECFLRCYGSDELEIDLRAEIDAEFSTLEDRQSVAVTGDYEFEY